jgi:glycine cleavage system T protein (aminomethyltransferase)
MTTSLLWKDMEAAGGIASDYHGRSLMRHFGDPAGEYSAATERVAVFDRSHRVRLSITGRSPGQMLNGILTGRLPSAPVSAGEGVLGGSATYHAVLTPKGKMLTDLWAYSRGESEVEELLLDVPVAGAHALQENFKKYLPPRFAAVEDVSPSVGMITVVGP